MSRSRTNSGSQIGIVRIPTISYLNLEEILDFIQSSKRSQLSKPALENLTKYMNQNPNFREITRLHNQFIDIKNNFNLLLGLTPTQVQELHALVKNTRAFKELRNSHKVTTQDYKDFLQNEKKLLPLTQIIEWWTHNCEALKKLDVWENIGIMIANESNANQELDEAASRKLHQLTDIKNTWISQQYFAGYSGEQLLTFYSSFICKIEAWIRDFIKNETPAEARPAIINEYLTFLLGQIVDLKRHAINSMLSRLRCAENYQNLRHDDLLVFTCDQIKKQCGAMLIKEDKKPATRKSSSPAILATYIKLIMEYLKNNPNEKNLANRIKQLKMQKLPVSMAITEPQRASVLTNYPVVIYIENSLPDLLDEVASFKHIGLHILEKNFLSEKNNFLKKLKRLQAYALLEKAALAKQKPAAIEILMEQTLNQQLNKIAQAINDIQSKLNIELLKQTHDFLDEVFTSRDTPALKIDLFLKKARSAVIFNKKYFNNQYNSHCDIILHLGLRVKSILAKNQYITPNEINNILKLITTLAPETDSNATFELKKVLAQLPDTAQKLNSENEGELLHLLLQFLEGAQLNRDNLQLALARHKHVASMYHENWDATFNALPSMSPEDIYIHNICSYIKNVLLKIIPISPYVDFTNFDNNEMCSTLADIQRGYQSNGKTSPILKAQFESLQYEFQKKIVIKLNDLFIIKAYLHPHDSKKIDVDKLKSLLTRIDIFFTHQASKNAIRESINKSVRVLLKNYALNILQNDTVLDKDYVYNLNVLFNENLLSKFNSDDELLKIISTYLETYNGGANNLASFLVEFFPKTHATACEKYIQPYAKKRLEYIKASNEVNTDDFLFFANYSNNPQVSGLLVDTKKHFTAILQTSLSSTQKWNRKTAYLVELFGSEQTMLSYRLKRILELLQEPNLDQPYTDDIDKAVLEFTQSINTVKLQGTIIDPAMLVKDKQTFQEFLNTFIATHPWSYLLEKVVEQCGSLQQAQALHFKLTKKFLDENVNCENTWLDKTLKANAESLGEIDSLQNQTHDLERSFYLRFYGPQNFKLICQQFEQILLKLSKADEEFSSKTMEKNDYKNIHALICTLKPFARMCSLFTADPNAKTALTNLDVLENKLSLHYNLNTVLKRRASLLDIARENKELHNLILSIIDTIRKIESKQMLTEHGINDYLVFFDREILSKIEIILAKNQASHSYKVLYYLANLTIYLASDNMKLLLLEGNKKNCLENPNWLHLINHFDERKELPEIEKFANDPLFPTANKNDYNNVVQFAKHLTNIKHLSHQLIKRAIFKQAEITLESEDLTNIPAIFQARKLKDNHYIKLWLACVDKLQGEQIDSQYRADYLNFLIKFTTKISNIILSKARKNPALLNEFIHQFSHIYAIKNRLSDLTKQADRITSPRSSPRKNNEFFNKPPALEKALQPFFMIIDKAIACDLMQRLDKFALKYINPKQLATLQTISEDPKYTDIKNQTHNQNKAIIQFGLGINNEVELTKIIAITGLYHHLQNIGSKGQNPAQLTNYIDGLIRDSVQNHILKKSHSYSTLLTELRALSAKYFSLQENRGFLFQFNEKSKSDAALTLK